MNAREGGSLDLSYMRMGLPLKLGRKNLKQAQTIGQRLVGQQRKAPLSPINFY